MEQAKQQQKTLADYTDTFEQLLSGNDKIDLAKNADVSLSTLYSYLKGNMANKHTAKAILEEGLKILDAKYPGMFIIND